MSLVAFAFPEWRHVLEIILLVLGFGFVIFFHELGHFLAAKWVGIKVEQFAVGFGQAVFSWRQGIGWRVGNTQKEYNQKIDDWLSKNYKGELPANAPDEQRRQAEQELRLGETEYRLNWIPLGGYVKMLGQDDLRPNATADDPRSFNNKSVGARMIVVSAGVIMNVILAGIGFMALFMYGFHAPPAVVGTLTSWSPAQNTYRLVNGAKIPAPLHVGDKIVDYDGSPQYDFTKIGLSAALSEANVAVPINVRHLDGKEEVLQIMPIKDDSMGGSGFLSLGIRPPSELAGIDPKEMGEAQKDWELHYLADYRAVDPGERVTQINGQDVTPQEFWKLDQAMQNPDGKPVELTVENEATQAVRHTVIHPSYDHPFGAMPLNFAGMMPRPMIPSIIKESPAVGVILPGDVVVSVSAGSDVRDDPSSDYLRQTLDKAGHESKPVTITVLRDGKVIPLKAVTPNQTVSKGHKGLGIGLGYDSYHAVVAEVEKDSPAERAGIPARATITAIDGQPVTTWFDVQKYLSAASVGKAVKVDFTMPPVPGSKDPVPGQKEMMLTGEQIASVHELRRETPPLPLRELNVIRKAKNPLQAAAWGVTETRDFILQFYLTLRRMVSGSVSPDQLMGPIGIFVGGAKFAFKGGDWLLWFLAMISANLAVVNFLPIPIVDGGLFTFLILEKIQGKPLSPRTHAIAQYVGLAFLAGVFLFVTYHDITRW